MSNKLQKLVDRIGKICRAKNWDKNWGSGGCYIHLEVSEFIEALRGKGDSTPESEAGDVLVSFFAVLDNYNIKINSVLKHAEDAISKLEKGLE